MKLKRGNYKKILENYEFEKCAFMLDMKRLSLLSISLIFRACAFEQNIFYNFELLLLTSRMFLKRRNVIILFVHNIFSYIYYI